MCSTFADCLFRIVGDILVPARMKEVSIGRFSLCSVCPSVSYDTVLTAVRSKPQKQQETREENEETKTKKGSCRAQ